MTEKQPLFIDDEVISVKKSGKRVFGDFTACIRNENHTDFILCDGIGSGVKASIAARMCVSRIRTLLEGGMSVKKTAERLAGTMHGIRSREIPYAVFVIARILNDGNFTVSGYEIPVPVLMYDSEAKPADVRFYQSGGELMYEFAGSLEPGMSMLLCSDGITQAGMGRGFAMGWSTKGLAAWLDGNLQRGTSHTKAAEEAFSYAVGISGGHTDDMTIATLSCRNASIVNLLTGPPADWDRVTRFVNDFMAGEGLRIVCGSSTMDMVSRTIGKPVGMTAGKSFAQPPKYSLEGIDLAAEGAVTLNQIYNILDEDRAGFDEESVVTEICTRLQDADIIRIFMGDAVNTGHDSIIFRQTGILPRHTIVPLIIEKLKSNGKTVTLSTP